MKTILSTLVFAFFLSSCSLTSNTIIKPKDSFVLGNNQHGSFKVKLKNVSKNNLEVYQAPIEGGKHSFQKVKPNEYTNVKVDRNTALIINNMSKDTASVNLKVTGDLNLGMTYQK
jgi:PBP1b-binding outer membrane lipoprotein LpoB